MRFPSIILSLFFVGNRKIIDETTRWSSSKRLAVRHELRRLYKTPTLVYSAEVFTALNDQFERNNVHTYYS